MKTKLYRATNRKSDARKIPAGSCWTPSKEDAKAYTNNPGYGGKNIISIEINPKNILDLRSGTGHDDWGALRDILYPDMDIRDAKEEINERIWGELESAEDALDDADIRHEIAQAGYDWVIYEDTYPAQCETWRKL
jgi:hypothetical protein